MVFDVFAQALRIGVHEVAHQAGNIVDPRAGVAR
jgi:hypothetical protein